jgi:hypothetical protein
VTASDRRATDAALSGENRLRDSNNRPTHSVPALRDFLRRGRVVTATVFVLCFSGLQIADRAQHQPPAFVVDMSSNTNSIAQLFYDVGRGINERDSVTLSVAASSEFSRLRFALPRATIRALRFDPLNGPGTVSLQRASIEDAAGAVLYQFSQTDVVALHQIASGADSGSEQTFSTIPSANDPMLQVTVRNPINLAPSSRHSLARVSLQLFGCLLIATLIGAAYCVAQPRLARVGPVLDRMALSDSDPALFPVDRLAMGCYLGILAFFVVSVSAGVHGSGISLYSTATTITARSVQPIIGTAKPIRSDEWAYHTPAILHQLYRVTPFNGETTPLGPDHSSLIANIPVRHFTMIFRPQFWGFFVLPPAYAFAFYWQCKALLLLTGVFSLLLLLTHSSKIAAFGTLWYVFSPNIQWTYSWPSLLPEMIGLFCIVICAVCYMSVGRRPARLIAAAGLCAVGAVNFALCAYIPHLIPLVWFGVFLCIWWVSAKWNVIFNREYALARITALGVSWLVVGLVMFGFYRDVETALTTMANTVYPGRRSAPAGSYPVLALFSHFFSFWEDERRFPQMFVNICECAGFFWLAPVTLFSIQNVNGGIEKKRAYWILTIFGALLFAWMTLPVPQAIGRLLFMDKAGGGRDIHVLGLVNVALVALFFSLQRTQPGRKSRLRHSVILGAAIFAIVYPVFLLVNTSTSNFLSTNELALAAGYATVLFVAVTENWFRFLAAFLVLPQIAVFGLVNPVDRGLQVFESSELFRFVHSRPELLRDRWIVFSGTLPDSTFFSAVGCEVITGLKYVPDLNTLRAFDPTGAQRDLLNRSAWLFAVPDYDNRPATFEQVPPNLLKLSVNPLNPVLRSVGVRYAAFPREPPPDVAGRMKPLANWRLSGFWLYELP